MSYKIPFGEYAVRAGKDAAEMWSVKETMEKFSKELTTFVGASREE